jgi:hypothetical protein
MPQPIMPTQVQPLWTEEQGVAIENMRRELQRVNQEHEAILEQQKEALLQCQHEIQSLRQLTIELQQSIERLSTPAAPSAGSYRKTTSIEPNPVRTLSTLQRPTKRQRVTLETARFEDVLHAQTESSERMASSRSDLRRSTDAQSHPLRNREVYVYASLTDLNNIRLLELESGPYFTSLQCRLVVSRLTGDRPYQALSYAWGETTKTHHVIIEGKRLPISANLDRALRRIRHTEQNLCLWVDAICINQDDADEKEKQISMMLQIYQSARRVVAYLGEQSDHSELMPQFFDITIRAFRVFQSLDNVENNIDHDDMNRSMATMEEIGDPTSNNIMWRAARAFYGRPWMLRVWVVQEVIAANELVFLCGGWELPGSIVFESVTASVRWPQLCPFGDLTTRPGGSEEEGFLQLFRLDISRSNDLPGGTDLLDLLYLSYGCKATDPRDRVFALLGLAQDAAEPVLRPNYCEDWRATYLRYTEYFSGKRFGLRVLYVSSTDTASTYKQSGILPSWVVDFSFEGKRIWLADNSQVHGEATAGGHDVPSLRINSVLRILTIQAILLDSIQSLSPGQAHQQISDPYTQVIQWRTELEELLPSEQSSSTEDIQDTLCRVMLCKQEPPNLESFRPMIWSTDSTEFDKIVDRQRLFRELVLVCTPRRRCITSTGFLGQVPLHAQKDDVIVIPIGSAVPFVLRPHQARYQLVGQAYIHGVMTGEALQFDHLAKEEIELL